VTPADDSLERATRRDLTLLEVDVGPGGAEPFAAPLTLSGEDHSGSTATVTCAGNDGKLDK
jgi:hypothetical protein